MKAAWPTTTELNAYLSGLNLTVPAGLAVADVLTAAIQEWEFSVGVSPWLAPTGTASSTSKFFTPAGWPDLVIPPAAAINTVKVRDSVLTLNENYFLHPGGASTGFRPFTRISFRDNLTGYENSVEVVANWGYQTQIFEDVWLLVMDLAVARIIEARQMANNAGGPVTEVKQADVTIKFGSGSWQEKANAKKMDLAKRYRVVHF